MKEKVRFLGLDVHAETMAVAIAGPDGAVPSENSSGQRTQRGRIAKTGNAHLRRIVVEAAWSYRLRPGVGPALRNRQEGCRKRSRKLPGKRNTDCTSAIALQCYKTVYY
ncbi:MAG: transposase [Acidobacteriaceae bacterium]